MQYDVKIIREFIKIIEANLKFKGSPKGGGPATPYEPNKTKPVYGKSEYDDLDDQSEEHTKKKIKVSKYLKEKGEEADEEWRIY